MKHLTLFNTEADYNSSELSLPNVSYSVESDVVKYHPFDPYAQPVYIDIPENWNESEISYPDVKSTLYDFYRSFCIDTYQKGNVVCFKLYVQNFDGHNVGDVEVYVNDWEEMDTFNINESNPNFVKYVSNISVQQPDGNYLPVTRLYFDEVDIECPSLSTEGRSVQLGWNGEIYQVY